MSKSLSTGYLLKTNNEKTYISLADATHWVSARVRWKGIDTALTDSLYHSGSGQINIPSPPSGYAFYRHSFSWYSTIRNDSDVNLYLQMDRMIGTKWTIVYGPVLVKPGETTSYKAYLNTSLNYSGLDTRSSWTGQGIQPVTVTQFNTVRTYGQKTVKTTNPAITKDATTVQHIGAIDAGVETGWYNITFSLTAGIINNFTNLFSSQSRGYVEVEYTFEPKLPIPINKEPVHDSKDTVLEQVFYFALVEDSDNSATKYHARIRFDDFSTMLTAINYQSKVNQTNWEYWNGAAWAAFPAGGVDPNTSVRFTKTFSVGTVFWDVATWDDYGYGAQGTAYKIRLMLVVEDRYVLNIEVPQEVSNYREGINMVIVPSVPIGSVFTNHIFHWTSKVTNNGGTNVEVKYQYIVGGGSFNVGGWILLTPGQSTVGVADLDLDVDKSDTNTWSAWLEIAGKYPQLSITDGNTYVYTYGSLDFTEYKAFDLTAPETCNGEIGAIVAVIDNKDGVNFGAINYGDQVMLAFKDTYGNTEEFLGVVRERNPTGDKLEIYAILGDGILAERIIQENYGSQDIGITIKAVIDDYCSPLTSTNVDISTGFVAEILTDEKVPLVVFEELRKKYGVFFYVDKDWDVHFYVPADIAATPTAIIKYGE